jgi:integrase
MPLIKNERYKGFKDTGFIDFIKSPEFCTKVETIHTNGVAKTNQLRAFFRIIYLTSRRPSEILELRLKDFKEDDGLKIHFQTKKGGEPTTLILPPSPITQKIQDYIKTIVMPEQLLFPLLRSDNTQTIRYKTKAGEPREKKYLRVNTVTFRAAIKYFGVPPYFFRHNRLSMVMDNGGTLEDARYIKGAKGYSSVIPYAHMSTARAKKIARFMED